MSRSFFKYFERVAGHIDSASLQVPDPFIMVTVQHYSNVTHLNILSKVISFDHIAYCYRILLQIPFHMQDMMIFKEIM